MTTAYLAPEGLEAELAEELGDAVVARYGRLFLVERPLGPVAWAQNTWLEAETFSVRSIKHAADELRARQRNWAGYSHVEHRRAALIQEALPHVSAKPIEPYAPLPTAPLGGWTLIDRGTVLASARCSSPFAHGEPRFVEDKVGPPSRAYLKLWEAFTLERRWPAAGSRVVDLGSAPGGWTWVLAELGAEVLSVDKAPLEPALAARANVEARAMSAFALEPTEVGPVDWVFSDIICYPRRLWSLVERWRAVHPRARFVCSVKRQGEPDLETVARFAAVEGSRLVHLAHNRHELTWITAEPPPA